LDDSEFQRNMSLTDQEVAVIVLKLEKLLLDEGEQFGFVQPPPREDGQDGMPGLMKQFKKRPKNQPIYPMVTLLRRILDVLHMPMRLGEFFLEFFRFKSWGVCSTDLNALFKEMGLLYYSVKHGKYVTSFNGGDAERFFGISKLRKSRLEYEPSRRRRADRHAAKEQDENDAEEELHAEEEALLPEDDAGAASSVLLDDALAAVDVDDDSDGDIDDECDEEEESVARGKSTGSAGERKTARELVCEWMERHGRKAFWTPIDKIWTAAEEVMQDVCSNTFRTDEQLASTVRRLDRLFALLDPELGPKDSGKFWRLPWYLFHLRVTVPLQLFFFRNLKPFCMELQEGINGVSSRIMRDHTCHGGGRFSPLPMQLATPIGQTKEIILDHTMRTQFTGVVYEKNLGY
jgi:hypothetical protein